VRWLAVALFLPSLAIGAERVVGEVVAISDGDTLTILDARRAQHRIRLDGIDAPERGQGLGQRSKDSLADLVRAKRVKANCTKRDRYGRQVCTVVVSGFDVGLEQIRRGMAWHYKRYAHEQTSGDRSAYAAAEATARKAGLGLWREPAPMPPWEWRVMQRD
jgi:endonuclease YncB( thermonuclease family)